MSNLILNAAKNAGKNLTNTKAAKTDKEYLTTKIEKTNVLKIIDDLTKEHEREILDGNVTYFSDSEITLLNSIASKLSGQYKSGVNDNDNKLVDYLVSFFESFCRLQMDCMCMNAFNKAILVVRQIGKSGRCSNSINDVSSQNIDEFIKAVSPKRLPNTRDKAFVVSLVSKIIDIIAGEQVTDTSFMVSRSTKQKKQLRKNLKKSKPNAAFDKLPTKSELEQKQQVLRKFKNIIDSQIGAGGLAAYLSYPSIFDESQFGIKRKFCMGTKASTGKTVMMTLLRTLYTNNFVSVLASRPAVPKSGFTLDVQSWNNQAVKCQIVAIDDDAVMMGNMTDFLKNFYNENSVVIGTSKDKYYTTFEGFVYMNMNNLTEDFESSKKEIRKRIYFLRLDDLLLEKMTIDEIKEVSNLNQTDIVDFLNDEEIASEAYNWFDEYKDDVYLDDLMNVSQLDETVIEMIDEFLESKDTLFMTADEFQQISRDLGIDCKLKDIESITNGKYVYKRRRFRTILDAIKQFRVIVRSDLNDGLLTDYRPTVKLNGRVLGCL